MKQDWRAHRMIQNLMGSRRVAKLNRRGVEVVVRLYDDTDDEEGGMSGNSIKRVTESVQEFQKTVDTAADALAGRAAQLKERTLDGLHKVGRVFDEAEAALDGLEDLVNQTSNNPPTETTPTE